MKKIDSHFMSLRVLLSKNRLDLCRANFEIEKTYFLKYGRIKRTVITDSID